MTIQNLVLATAIVAFGAAQYTLAYQAIRDLIRRPRVRGGNKMTWAIAILCLPVVGALFYNWMGPTSFLRRGHIAAPAAPRMEQPRPTRASVPTSPRPQNVTPLRPRRTATATTTRPTGRRASMTRSRAHSSATGINRVRRTGS